MFPEMPSQVKVYPEEQSNGEDNSPAHYSEEYPKKHPDVDADELNVQSNEYPKCEPLPISNVHSTRSKFRFACSWTMFAFIDANICRAYGCYGRFLGRHPWPFVVIPFLLSLITPLGLMNRNEVRDIPKLYTPTDSRFYEEQDIIRNLWPNMDGMYAPNKALSQHRQCQVILSPLNASESILEDPYSEDVEDFNSWVMSNIYVFHKGERYTYTNLCYHMYDGNCWDNTPMWYAIGTYRDDPRKLTFPSFYVSDAKVYIASMLGGVERRVRDGNLTDEVDFAKTWLLIFQLRFDNPTMDEISGLWEIEFEQAMKSMNHPNLRIQFFHSQSPFDEMSRSGKMAFGRFTVTFLILIIFTMICGIKLTKLDSKRKIPIVDWSRTKSMLGLFACLTAGIGCLFSIAFFTVLKAQWNPILALMPFLIVAIGVDNMFLLIAAWRRTDLNAPTHERMGETLSTAAISITITALTDAASFAVACITTLPAVYQFCMYTAMAVVVTFVYQMTFFLGVMTLYGRLEERGRHHFLFCKVKPIEDFASASQLELLSNMGRVPRHQKHASNLLSPRYIDSQSGNFFRNRYGKVLSNPIVKVIVILVYVLYIGITTYGVLFIREGLDPRNLIPEPSYLLDYYTSMQDYIWPYGPEVQIVVSNPPNFNNETAIDEAYALVRNFTNTEYTMGYEGVTFFLDDFIFYMKSGNKWDLLHSQPTTFGSYLKSFLKSGHHSRFQADVAFGRKEDGEEFVIKAFRFNIGMMHFKTQYQQMRACQTIRGVGYSMPQYNISTLWPLWGYMDQYMMVIPNALQNILIALVTMVIVSILLIPHLLNAIGVAFCIMSIAYGLIGFMTLWGVDFDAAAMITMAMSVGFSVDFAAHISHRYVTSKENTPNEKMCDALGELAWPILQGAVSTVLGVMALSTVKSNVIRVFFKMVFMVIIFGLIHALLFLPVLLSLLVRSDWRILFCGKPKE